MAGDGDTATPLRTATYVKVKDVTPDSHGHNLVVKIVSVDIVQEKKRFDGSTSRIAEAVVGDETGIVTLTARNDQIEKLTAGETIVIRNCSADVFNGFVRLNVSVWGKLSPHPDGVASTPSPPASVNHANNISGVEYELVTVEETAD